MTCTSLGRNLIVCHYIACGLWLSVKCLVLRDLFLPLVTHAAQIWQLVSNNGEVLALLTWHREDEGKHATHIYKKKHVLYRDVKWRLLYQIQILYLLVRNQTFIWLWPTLWYVPAMWLSCQLVIRATWTCLCWLQYMVSFWRSVWWLLHGFNMKHKCTLMGLWYMVMYFLVKR